MLQYMAQGACQALEDVACLARHIQKTPENLPQAFEAYASERYLRTARVQFSARQMIEMCQVQGLLADLRASYFSKRTPNQFYDSLAWLYSAKPTEKFV
jgi:salicylate hydroxylase